MWLGGSSKKRLRKSAAEREGNSLNGFKDLRTENGSSQGQNPALTGLFVPSWLDSRESPPLSLSGSSKKRLPKSAVKDPVLRDRDFMYI